MTDKALIERAIRGHASTRVAMRWLIAQVRGDCVKICEEVALNSDPSHRRLHPGLWKLFRIEADRILEHRAAEAVRSAELAGKETR